MKLLHRFGLGLGLVLAISSLASAQAVYSTSCQGNPCTVSSVPAGSTELIYAFNVNSGAPNVTDNGASVSAEYSDVNVTYPIAAADGYVHLLVVPNVSAGTHTINFAFTSPHYDSYQVVVVSGASYTAPVVSLAHSQGTSTPDYSCGPVTPDVSGGLVVSFGNLGSGPASTPANMTAAQSDGGSGSGYANASGTTPFTAAWNGGGNEHYSCEAMAIVQASGAPPTLSSVTVSPSTLTLQALVDTGTLTATCHYSDSSAAACPSPTWTSSNTGVATVNAGSVTALSAGTATITATQGSYSGTSTATVTPKIPVTWYVRPDGGTRYSTYETSGQCDGKTDAAYPGSGVNQHCAFSDPRMLVFTGAYTTGAGSGGYGWIGTGGDTYILRGSIADGVTYRVGYPALNSPTDGNGWYLGLQGDSNGSGFPPPPNGSTIEGGNYANCSAESQATQLHGGWGLGDILVVGGTNGVTVRCLDFTDWAGCGFSYVISPCKVDGAYISDYAVDGFGMDEHATNLTVRDIWAHGMTRYGFVGPTGDGAVMTNINLTGNGGAGWSADLSDGYTGTGTLSVTHFNISWNGCIEEYPIVHAEPYVFCNDQSNGGYGDGFGTPTVQQLLNPTVGTAYSGTVTAGTLFSGSLPPGLSYASNGALSGTPTTAGIYAFSVQDASNVNNKPGYMLVVQAAGTTAPQGWRVHLDQGVSAYNTQDGLDALHLTGPGSSMTITRTLDYGNMGQQIKVGGQSGTAQNNIIYNNCNALRQPIPGTPAISQSYTFTSFVTDVSGNITLQTPGGTFVPGADILPQNFTGAAAWLNNAYVIQIVSSTSTSVTGFIVGGIATDYVGSFAVAGTGYVGYNSGLTDYCRAGDQAVLLSTGRATTATFTNNTLIGTGAIGVEIQCDGTNGACDSTSLIDFRNNVFVGYPDDAAHGTPGGSGYNPSPIYMCITDSDCGGIGDLNVNPLLNAGSHYDHNLTYGAKYNYPCPQTGETNALCVDPLLTDESWHLYGYGDVSPTANSPLLNAGTPVSGVTTDYNGAARSGSTPTIGAIEAIEQAVVHALGKLQGLHWRGFHR